MNHSIEFRAMGCKITAIVESDHSPELLQQVPVWFEEWEACLSRFRPNSELSQLNRAAGCPVHVSETLWQVFEVALQAEQESHGLVTPTVLQSLLAAGYDRSFETLPRERESALGGWAPTVGTLAEVSWDAATRSLCLPVDVQLDFGGVAKGWAADQAAKRLASCGAALVCAGGDISICGELPAGERWPVGVDDPFHPGESLHVLMLRSAGVATSGTDYRRWKQGGQWNHHIIDPRTGLPAQTDILAATVIAETAVQAEVAAKVTLLLGSHQAADWFEENPQLAGLLVLDNGDQFFTKNMESFLWSAS